MRFPFLRVLVLACSLLLVLPPGWCCFAFGPKSASARTAQATDANVPPCCKHKLGSGSSAPKQTPRPTKHGGCPCDERAMTAVDATKGPGTGPALVVFLPHGALTPESVGTPLSDFGPALPTPSAEPPLHLIHCVWRC